MRTTITLAANLDCSPFTVFDQDTDEVIMLINFYIRLGDEIGNEDRPAQVRSAPAKEQRIRVNDKTATGGWW